MSPHFLPPASLQIDPSGFYKWTCSREVLDEIDGLRDYINGLAQADLPITRPVHLIFALCNGAVQPNMLSYQSLAIGHSMFLRQDVDGVYPLTWRTDLFLTNAFTDPEHQPHPFTLHFTSHLLGGAFEKWGNLKFESDEDKEKMLKTCGLHCHGVRA